MDELEILISADLNVNQSIPSINKSIEKLEKKINKLKLQATLDNGKSKAEIKKQIETLNKQKKKLYVDLQLRKDTLKKQYQEIQKENNLSLNVDTVNAQKQIKNVSSVMGDTKNETVGLGLALKNAFSNAGLVISAQTALQMIRKAASEATQAVKEYDRYATNLSVITGGSRESSNQLLGDLAEKSLDFKVDISDLEGAAETILRTGKSIDETNKYLENTVYLSKLGFQDMDTSASQLVTIGNAYGYTADEMSKVVDKFTKLDTSANVTAGKLAEGVAKSAQNSKLAGFNIDQLSASIAGLKDTTGRSESEIANSLNMIFSRLQNVKLGKFVLETEDGTEDITQQINDTEKLLDTFGIKLRNSKNEFRDISELFTELSDNWSKFNSVQQSAIASTIAGARQRNTFIGLIENWNKIQELTDVSLNSMGTAVQKYDNYLNSIEAKSAVLQTSLKELWNNLLPNDFVGNMTDAGTAVVQFTDKYQILQTAIKSATFYALAKGAIAAKNSLTGMVTDIKNVSTAFTQLEAVQKSSIGTKEYKNNIKALGTTVSSLTDNQAKLLLSTKSLSDSQRIAILKATGLEEAEAKAKLQTLGLSQANQQATTATFSLSGAFKTLWATIAANPVMALTVAFTAVSTIISSVQRKNEELRQSISDSAQAAKEQTDKLNDLVKSYEEFADKVTYTAEEKEKLKEIQGQLVEAYHTEVDGIDLVNGKYDEQIEKLRQLKKEKLEDAELSLTAQREQAHRDSSYENLPNKSFNISADWFNSDDDYNKIVDELEKRVKGFTTDIALVSKAVGIDSQINLFAGNADYRIEQIKEAMEILKENGYANIGLYSELNKLLSEYQELSNTENAAISNLAENKFQQYQIDNPYNEKSGKDAYLSWKKGLIESANGDTELQQELTALAEKQFPDYQKYFDNLAKARRMFRQGANSAEASAYENQKDNFLTGLSDEDLEIAVQIPDLFKNGLEGAEQAIKDFKNDPDNQITVNVETSEADTSGLDKLQEAYDDLSKSADSYTKSQKTLTDALKEQKEHGQLSADTIKSLSEAGYSQAIAVAKETGAVTLNMEAYNRLNEQKKLKIKLDIEQQNTELETKLKEEESAISSLKMEYEALANANAQANAERLKAIEIELAQRSQNKSKLQGLVDKNNSVSISLDAPTFDTSSTKTDAWKETAEKKFADLEHLYAMDKISYASYLNQLDKLNQYYYGNNEKYLDEFRKNEEKVYQGRKKLNEDLIAEEEKQQKAYHDKRISELETQITVTTKNSVDDQGNKLIDSEKFDYIRDIYDEILAEIERRENEIVQSGVEGHEDELAELIKLYEEYANKKSDIFNDEIQQEMDYISNLEKKYNDFIDKRIDRYEDEKKAIEDKYDAEIKSIDDTINALKDKNDVASKSIELKKALQNLENAKQRTRMVYGSDGTIAYRQDTEKIEEAQQKVDDIKLDMVVSNLEKQKEALEEQKNIEVDKFDNMITALNEQKDTQEKYFEILIEILENYSNPKATENIKSVWDRIFADKENVKVNDTNANVRGTDIDTSGAVFGEVDADKVNQTLDKASDRIAKMLYKTPEAYERYKRGEYGNIFEKLSGIGISNSYNQAQSIVDNINQNISKMQSVNVKPSVSVGELSLNIQTPVGTIEEIARHAATGVLERAERQAMMELPNAFQKQMYTNLK